MSTILAMTFASSESRGLVRRTLLSLRAELVSNEDVIVCLYAHNRELSELLTTSLHRFDARALVRVTDAAGRAIAAQKEGRLLPTIARPIAGSVPPRLRC
jgi:hypothetical protein